jgi:hypothetical protein
MSERTDRKVMNTLERLRAESMNPAQTNRQLIVDAHEEIRILRDEVARAHARSIEMRLRFEGRWERLKDASLEAMNQLTQCRSHHDTQTGQGDSAEMWKHVTGACKTLYECIKNEVDLSGGAS